MSKKRVYRSGDKEHREYESKDADGKSSFNIYSGDPDNKVGSSQQSTGESRQEARDRAWDRAKGRRKD